MGEWCCFGGGVSTTGRLLDGVSAGRVAVLDRHGPVSRNHKWREDLTDAQQAMISDILQPCLDRYGYA